MERLDKGDVVFLFGTKCEIVMQGKRWPLADHVLNVLHWGDISLVIKYIA